MNPSGIAAFDSTIYTTNVWLQNLVDRLEELTAGDVMSAPVEMIEQDMPLRQAARVLACSPANCVPVVDGRGRCGGMLPPGDRHLRPLRHFITDTDRMPLEVLHALAT